MNNNTQSFTVELKNMEVRRVDVQEIEIGDTVYKSLAVAFDTEDAQRLVFKDKDVSKADQYKRGMVGTLILYISTENTIKTSKTGKPYIAEKTVITIEDFIPDEA